MNVDLRLLFGAVALICCAHAYGDVREHRDARSWIVATLLWLCAGALI